MRCPLLSLLFFFNDTATTEIYTLSLHDALPISAALLPGPGLRDLRRRGMEQHGATGAVHDQHSARPDPLRSEEHTSELQSRSDLVCRLLLEKKKRTPKNRYRLITASKQAACRCS